MGHGWSFGGDGGEKGVRLSRRHSLPETDTTEDLAETFPGNRESLILAYEESRSVIEYISRRYGKEEILEILGRMRNGEALADAIRDVMPVTLAQLEEDWHDDLMERATWFFLVADNVYEILFFLAALITAYAFFALIIRRRVRAKMAEDEEDE